MAKTSIALPVAPFETISYGSGDEFMAIRRELAIKIKDRRERELALAEYGEKIAYPGQCTICGRDVTFSCDWDVFRTLPDGRKEPSWRERLVCSSCGLSNRLRASLHQMLDAGGLNENSAVYLTEQTTPFYSFVKGYCKNVVGSEYLRDGTARGSKNWRFIRHEDITNLTFKDATFDIIGCFEVMEHVPDYKAGLNEMCRVLKPGGHLVATFPFRSDLLETLVRAKIDEKGEIVHLLEPEYHGDPLDRQGVLCYYHFGWDILDALREAGFKEARCHYYWSWEHGYLGGALPQFHAIK
jgi:SAM-dependent methyltransferase